MRIDSARAAETSPRIARARGLASLGEAAEADGVGRRRGRGEGLLVGRDPVPGDTLADGEAGCPSSARATSTVPVGRSGSVWTVSVGMPRRRNRLQHLPALVVVADPRHQSCEGAEGAAMEREVGRRPAELLAGRQQVPEHFPDGENLQAHKLVPPARLRRHSRCRGIIGGVMRQPGFAGDEEITTLVWRLSQEPDPPGDPAIQGEVALVPSPWSRWAATARASSVLSSLKASAPQGTSAKMGIDSACSPPVGAGRPRIRCWTRSNTP